MSRVRVRPGPLLTMVRYETSLLSLLNSQMLLHVLLRPILPVSIALLFFEASSLSYHMRVRPR